MNKNQSKETEEFPEGEKGKQKTERQRNRRWQVGIKHILFKKVGNFPRWQQP